MYKQEMVELLSELVRIPSLDSEDRAPGAPYGKEIARALEYALDTGKSMGFETRNLDGYVGEIQLGTGSKMMGILCHIDVVEPGEGWNTPPFEPTLIGDKLYGRGSIDDKAGIICALYAMKQIEEQNLLSDDQSIRLIIGTNEELDWEDMDYYKENADRFPDVSLVIDANFPVIYCEKGLWDFNLTWENVNGPGEIKLLDLEGGVARNSLPSKAKAVLSTAKVDELAKMLDDTAVEKGIEVQMDTEGDKLTVVTKGISVHAMWPENGESALNKLIDLLAEIPEDTFAAAGFVKAYHETLGCDFTGASIGIDCEDEESGALTIVTGQLKYDKDSDKVTLISGLRYPASKKLEPIEKAVKEKLGGLGFDVVPTAHLEPIYFEKDNAIIQKVLEAYQELTGDYENGPISIGGATYSRTLPNAIAFGPLFPWEQELAHEPNEFMDINSLEKACDIVVRALCKLQEIN